MSHLIQKVLTFALRSGLQNPKQVKLLAKGLAAETYQIVDEEKRYILVRFLLNERKIHAGLITRLSHNLANLGFPIPRIIDTGMLEGRLAILSEYIPGKVHAQWQKSEYEQLGLLMGSLHYMQESQIGEEKAPRFLDEISRFLLNLEDALPENFKIVFDEAEALDKAWPQDLPQGIIHGDIWHKNLFFNEKGEISALLDFNFPYFDVMIYDIGTVMKSIYLSKGKGAGDNEFNAFLHHYQLARPLSGQEISFLPLMLCAKVLYTTLFMLEQASLRRESRDQFLSTAMFNLIKLQDAKEFSFEKIALS